MIDLNDLIPPDSGWTLHEAKDINESGQIVGWGLNPDGLGRGFLLTPCDFSGGPGEDCDGNGVPDECQSDCNGNGQPDVCDIADGISGDCDGDNVPDECDIGPPITQQPASQEVVAGDFALFYVAAEGLQLAYQWRKDGIDLFDTERIFGTQGSTLIILDVQPGDAGEYDCVVTDLLDSSCSFSDPATLTVVVTCPPDFDCDGDVDAADLAQLLGNWGPCPPEDACPADLDDDGAVNAFDLAQLLGSWGSS
ncbi:MAG: immunoglobulin domain-containing protein [Planctomycetes bacterium]|nr:immunoglobulin domain-containing protein [Planctomycetota bacterium]